MTAGNEQQKPSIHIFHNKNLIDMADFEEVFWGIEEEGVPYTLCSREEKEAKELAYEACETSPLGVGIGMDGENIVLHYNKLKKYKPLYQISSHSSHLFMRILGSNAARLVKRTPFKDLEDSGIGNIEGSEKDLEEEVRAIVEQVIARMKLG